MAHHVSKANINPHFSTWSRAIWNHSFKLDIDPPKIYPPAVKHSLSSVRISGQENTIHVPLNKLTGAVFPRECAWSLLIRTLQTPISDRSKIIRIMYASRNHLICFTWWTDCIDGPCFTPFGVVFPHSMGLLWLMQWKQAWYKRGLEM